MRKEKKETTNKRKPKEAVKLVPIDFDAIKPLDSIEAMLFHPVITNAYLCKILFGNSHGASSTFSFKKQGLISAKGRKFTDEEMAALEEIRLRFVGKNL